MRNVDSETPNNTTLVLHWQLPEPTNGDILHYIIRVTVHDDGNAILQENVINTTFTATNLSNQ